MSTLDPRVVTSSGSRSRLFAAVAASLVAHVLGAAALRTLPARRPSAPRGTVITLERWPDVVAKREAAPRPVASGPAESAPSAERSPAPARPTAIASRRGEAPARAPRGQATATPDVSGAVRSKGVLGALGALATTQGGIAGLAAARGSLRDMASGLPSEGMIEVGARGETRGGGSDGAGGAASIDDLGTSGGAGGRGFGASGGGLGAGGVPGPVGSVAAGGADIDSSDVTQGEVAGFVRARMGGIRACYEAQLRRNHALQGRITIAFVIRETGTLADVSANENTLGSAEVARCIVGMIRSWRTPFRPAASVSVEYPFVFSANAG
jgi:hypothetical protein